MSELNAPAPIDTEALKKEYAGLVTAQLETAIKNLVIGELEDVSNYAEDLSTIMLSIYTVSDEARREKLLEAVSQVYMLLLDRKGIRVRQNADNILRAILAASVTLLQRLVAGVTIAI